MQNTIPFFNWSVKRALAALPDSFSRAKAKILVVVLFFSFLKTIVVSYYTYVTGQHLQLIRAGVGMVAYIILIKIYLAYPQKIALLAHAMLMAGLVAIWSNVIVYVHEPNVPVTQFAFMVVLCSFYTLNNVAGIIYSTLAVFPIIFASAISSLFPGAAGEPLSSPAFETIIVLNFITIIVAHYYFYTAYTDNLKEKERLNKDLERSAAEAKELAEARSVFVSTVSHELRTPLNSVIGVTELLLEDIKDEKQQENLTILRYSTADLLSLINNILDINKLNSNKLQLDKSTFNLHQLINNVCSVLRIKAHEKQLSLHYHTEEVLKPVHVNSDATRITQILYNLLGNAIKFTNEGSVTVSLRTVAHTHEVVTVAFSIIDTGIGIPAEKLSVIFDPFTQVSKDTTHKYGGTGLGLAIVKQILHLFDSDIHVKSEEGKGATFSFTLQLPVVMHTRPDTADIHYQGEDISKLKILVAEDNEVNQLILQKQLEKLYLSAVMVPNGKAAYEEFMKGEYDTVLLDLDMPEMDGYETAKMIREFRHPQKSNAHIIAFTASVTEQEFILKSGFNDYLYKPVNMQDLREKLVKAAQNTRSHL